MTINIKSNSKGWELTKDSENLIIYVNKKLCLAVHLTKFEGKWLSEYTNGKTFGILGEPCDKRTAIARAKRFMHDNPTRPEMVPALNPGETPNLRANRFVNPGRVTNFSRHKR